MVAVNTRKLKPWSEANVKALQEDKTLAAYIEIIFT
jgi:hypothetical protein